MTRVGENRFLVTVTRPRALLLCLLVCTASAQAGDAAAPPVVDPSLQGAALFAATCAACHGPQGQGNDELRAPATAALPAWYVTNQLTQFREKRRGTDPSEPQAMAMAAIAQTLSPEQIKSVAQHLESLPRVVPKVTTLKDTDLREGQWLFEFRCMECHRYNGTGEMVFGSPPLIGQQGWYLEAQLQKFRTGKRGAAHGDVNGAKMVLSSRFIESDQQLRDLVAFILSLNPPAESNPFE